MRTKAVIAALAFLIAPACAYAQGRTLVTTTGVSIRIGNYTWFSFKDCKSLGYPEIQSIKASNGGKVWTQIEALPLKSSASPSGAHCVGKTMQSVAVYYLPPPNFSGTETVEYFVKYPAACTACVSRGSKTSISVTAQAPSIGDIPNPNVPQTTR